MSKTTDPAALAALAQSLAAVTARMEPEDAARACGPAAAVFIQAMSTTKEPALPGYLEQGLATVFSCAPSTTVQQRLLSVTATVAGLGGSVTPFAALASAQPALEPLPLPLPPQTLVDLLKHPSCVGQARRLVLGNSPVTTAGPSPTSGNSWTTSTSRGSTSTSPPHPNGQGWLAQAPADFSTG
jgi:hypothetical protein